MYRLFGRLPAATTVATDSEDLVTIPDRLEVVLRHNLFFQLLQLRTVEFNGPVALDADDVMMLGVAIEMFEPDPAVVQIRLARQSANRGDFI